MPVHGESGGGHVVLGDAAGASVALASGTTASWARGAASSRYASTVS